MTTSYMTPSFTTQDSIALPDVHSGYGFAIGNVAAFDTNDPQAVVSPGGVGFDINCGVRLIRTNLVSACGCILLCGPLPSILMSTPGCSGTSAHARAAEYGPVAVRSCHARAPTAMEMRTSRKLNSGALLSERKPETRREMASLQMEADVTDVKEQLAQSLFDHIPVGVGSQGIIPTSAKDLEAALGMGMDWSLREVKICHELGGTHGQAPALRRSRTQRCSGAKHATRPAT